MTILIIAEHDNQILNQTTNNLLTAAAKLPGEKHVLIAGNNCSNVATSAAKIDGATKILLADSPLLKDHMAENMASFILGIAANYTHILAPATNFARNFMPRIAAKLDVAQVSDVIEILAENSFKRPIYAGNAIATVTTNDKIKILTIRTTKFTKAANNNNANIEPVKCEIENFVNSSFVGSKSTQKQGPDLTSARVVISGGRGLGGKDNFVILENLSKKIKDSAIGASRAAVDAGYISNEYQVGQTGKIVAPELYFAIGISGAIQHLAGMKDSKIIIAINKDENAPIFEVADFGLVADLFAAIPELEKLL